jgi:radical SAM protein with 4Fe4S-binding SPASM domain
MDPKSFFKNKSICTLPWTGFELEPDGRVKNCVISQEAIGDINKTNIRDIVHGEKNVNLKRQMKADAKPSNCSGCYLQEKNRSSLSSISSRLYYLREIAPKTELDLYDDAKNFSLKHVDLRWTNSCNQACVYCSPRFSSKWASELGVTIKSNKDSRQDVKDFVYENVEQLQNVYLAGGEPMLMKENYDFLKLLKEKNPNCTIRVNTNLSTTQTGIFELLCSFKNVHWTVSVEAMEQEYEYIRHHGSWNDFNTNLDVIRTLNHKISFNMLHLILNYNSIFDCIDYLKDKNFHDNSFVIGPLYGPDELNLLNLPEQMINDVKAKLTDRLSMKPAGYLKNSYENLLQYFSTTSWDKNISLFYEKTKLRDERRNLDSKKIFPNLYKELDVYTLE